MSGTGKQEEVLNVTDHSFSIYPIPAADFIEIEVSSEMQWISIENLSGQKMAEWTNLEGNQTRLDVNFLSKGIYLLHIKSANKTYLKKIVIK